MGQPYTSPISNTHLTLRAPFPPLSAGGAISVQPTASAVGRRALHPTEHRRCDVCTTHCTSCGTESPPPHRAPEARFIHNPLPRLWDRERSLPPRSTGGAISVQPTASAVERKALPHRAPEARCLYNPLHQLWDRKPSHPLRQSLGERDAAHSASLGHYTAISPPPANGLHSWRHYNLPR